MLDLSQFLQQERAGGTYKSEGQFTVSLEKAREKLSKFALPSGEAWVDKLLQAVVGWRVKTLRVVQTREWTLFHFQPSLRFGLPTGREILDTFLHANIGGREPLQRFCLALHALRTQEQLSFFLALQEERVEPTVYQDGNHLNARSATSLLGKLAEEPGLTLAVSHLKDEHRRILRFWSNSGGSDIKRRAQIGQRLQDAAYAFPLPIWFDNRRIDQVEHLGQHFRQILALDSIALESRASTPILLPCSLMETLEDERRAGPLFNQEPHYLGYVVLTKSLERLPSTLYWLDDGAILESHTCAPPGHLSLTLFVSATDLPKDLTGLKLVKSSQKRLRTHHLTEHTRSILGRLLDSREQIRQLTPFAGSVEEFHQQMQTLTETCNTSLQRLSR